MKVLITLLLTIFTISAGAHPNSSTSLLQIGTGTKFIVTSDINIKPESNMVSFFHFVNPQISYVCDLLLTTTQPYDRVLKQGTELIVGEVKSNKEHQVELRFTNQPRILYLKCARGLFSQDGYWVDYQDPTIGETEIALQESFMIRLAEPRPL